MRIFALAAAVSMSLTPAVTMAQQSPCPANASLASDGTCVCDPGFALLVSTGACMSTAAPDVVVAVNAGQTAKLPLYSTIPPEALVIGGLVILAGVIIGLAAAGGDDTTGTTSTPGT